MSKLNYKLIAAGFAVGLICIILALAGNPANMAFCIACFIRDIAGGLKLQTAAPVQYIRPEIIGIIAGAFFISLATHEYKSTAGSSPAIRFVLGMIMMIGSLVFLGCPLRMVIRMAAGDLNAYVGLIGFIGGVVTGTFALKKGFSLGRSSRTLKYNGGVLPALMLLLFILSLTTSLFAASTKGPGSLHAPVFLSLAAGLIVGAIGQKARTCFAGSIRDIILLKNFDLFSIIAALYVTLLVFNIASGNFKVSFAGQPIAHSQHLWNILGMYATGFAAVLAGGCPFRQLVLAGQGATDSAVTFLGMLIGAAFAHNFKFAAAGATATSAGGPSINGKIAVIVCIGILFLIGFGIKRETRKKAVRLQGGIL
ncbi:MAG: YedE-related selenium metabolism membrane protein [Treponema sp.]|jgi:YedE family putative selenium metabolism protein|nr:YedE-related selenium metabolism membrane protein [Treponema sp.]